MTVAGIAFSCAVMLQTIIFIVPLFIIMAYSFFDCYNLRTAEKEGEKIADGYIFKGISFSGLKGNRLVGCGIILLGIYILLSNVLTGLANEFDFEIFSRIVRAARRYFPSLIAALLAIGAGFKMILGSKEE